MRLMKKILIGVLSMTLSVAPLLLVTGCRENDPGDFTADELALIRQSDSTMRVLTIADKSDSLILRDTSRMLSCEALLSDEYARLEQLMTATVTHPSQDGVGIAGPQVGLNRRVVAVQRFDKEGEPFEVYPNIRIIWASESMASGPEGCLSVPDRRGEVLRSTEITIEYTDIELLRKNTCSSGTQPDGDHRYGKDRTAEDMNLPIVTETISGFTTVIFQHEVDHLDGKLYIDRL